MRLMLIMIVVMSCGLVAPQSASSEDLSVDRELQNVRTYFQSATPVQLAKAQAVLSLSGHYRHPADGQWGPLTERAFEKMLLTYITIGGDGPEWGVNSPADTKRLLNWMDQAANAYLNDGEFPD